MNKKILAILLTGALSLTIIAPAISADTGVDTATGVVQSRQKGDFKSKRSTGLNIMELVEKYAPELTERFETVFAKIKDKAPQNKLDEATKEKIAEIRQQLKDGTITAEEAKGQMEDLGVKMPVHSRVKLDEATKEKLAEIRQQLKDGTITAEEAKEQMENLGIKMQVHSRVELDEATKEKLTEIRQKLKDGTITAEEAKSQMESLGVKMPVRPLVKLDEETKEKLAAIKEKLTNGSISQEQAKEEAAELGVKFFAKERPDNDVRTQLKEAVEANDTEKIKTLLADMLKDMENNIK